MDYTEAELEARIFPSVDIDPMDFMTDEELDEQFDNEPDCDDQWADANALASAGWGTDETMVDATTETGKLHYHIP